MIEPENANESTSLESLTVESAALQTLHTVDKQGFTIPITFTGPQVDVSTFDNASFVAVGPNGYTHPPNYAGLDPSDPGAGHGFRSNTARSRSMLARICVCPRASASFRASRISSTARVRFPALA